MERCLWPSGSNALTGSGDFQSPLGDKMPQQSMMTLTNACPSRCGIDVSHRQSLSPYARMTLGPGPWMQTAKKTDKLSAWKHVEGKAFWGHHMVMHDVALMMALVPAPAAKSRQGLLSAYTCATT